MRTKSFKNMLENGSPEEISEPSDLCDCPLCPPDHIFSAKTRKAIEDAEKGIGLRYAKDADDLFKQLGIKIKKKKKE